MMTVRVHYADDLRQSLFWEDIPEVDQTFTTVADDVILDRDIQLLGSDYALAEAVWAAFNRGSGSEDLILDYDGLRSMSVGDVVEIRDDDGPRFYRAASLGFKPIEGIRAHLAGADRRPPGFSPPIGDEPA